MARKSRQNPLLISCGILQMERHWDRIEHISDQTGLPVLEHWVVGLDGLKAVIQEAVIKGDHDTAD
jgi:hypothetical protein